MDASLPSLTPEMASTTGRRQLAPPRHRKRRAGSCSPAAAPTCALAFDPRAGLGDANGTRHELELFESRQAREQCNHFAPDSVSPRGLIEPPESHRGEVMQVEPEHVLDDELLGFLDEPCPIRRVDQLGQRRKFLRWSARVRRPAVTSGGVSYVIHAAVRSSR